MDVQTEDERDSNSDDDARKNEKEPDELKMGDGPDELEIKAKRKRIKPFTEDILISDDGLQRVYKEFPRICHFKGRGTEAKDMKRLTTMYKEWAFQLHPGLAFSEFLSTFKY